MNVAKQTTIANVASCYGIGVHFGRMTQITLRPASAFTGIVFVRTDVENGHGVISAQYNNVTSTTLCTCISNEYGISVSTVEHLMAALWGCGIDNVIVEIDGPEVPVMDGSSKAFVFLIDCAGIKSQNAARSTIKITKEVYFEAGDAYARVIPSDDFSIDVSIDFPQAAIIGHQELSIASRKEFISHCSDARTFGFTRDLDMLRSSGLALGASLDNAIGIDCSGVVLNHNGLRYNDEFVRHKLLDAVGDFCLAGHDIIGKFVCSKSGHKLHNELLRKLLQERNAYDAV